MEVHTPEALLDVVSLGIIGSLSSSSFSERSSSPSSSSDHGFLFFTFLGVPLAPAGFLCFGVPEDYIKTKIKLYIYIKYSANIYCYQVLSSLAWPAELWVWLLGWEGRMEKWGNSLLHWSPARYPHQTPSSRLHLPRPDMNTDIIRQRHTLYQAWHLLVALQPI